MKILVTGGLGYIGREVARDLLAAGHEVRSFDRGARQADVECEHVPGDLRHVLDVRRAIEGVDAVVHAGAIPNDRNGYPDDVFHVNVMGTLNVLQACVEAGVRTVVNFSSVNSLGNFGGHRAAAYLPIDDAYPHHPQTPYQLSKHLGEEACIAFADRHGMTCISLRPVAVIREGSFNRWRQADPIMRAEWGKGDYWAWVDLRDVVSAVRLSLAVEAPLADAFLLCAGDTTQELPTQELLDRFYPDAEWRGEPREAYFAADAHRGLVDCRHALDVLGWAPAHRWLRG